MVMWDFQWVLLVWHTPQLCVCSLQAHFWKNKFESRIISNANIVHISLLCLNLVRSSWTEPNFQTPLESKSPGTAHMQKCAGSWDAGIVSFLISPSWEQRLAQRKRLGLLGWWGDWSISPMRKGWGSWACSAWRREGWGGTLEMPLNICRVGVRRMEPDSFQWCPVTGQGAMGTNWSTGSSVWTWGRTSSLWRWRSPGTGCPEGLWILLLWRYSRLAWTKSCAAYCRKPCFGRGLGFCDSVVWWREWERSSWRETSIGCSPSIIFYASSQRDM